jgi:hypothetical protein
MEINTNFIYTFEVFSSKYVNSSFKHMVFHPNRQICHNKTMYVVIFFEIYNIVREYFGFKKLCSNLAIFCIKKGLI